MSSIIKRGGTYSVVSYLGRDEVGKKRQKWFSGFSTLEEAKKGKEVIDNLSHSQTYINPKIVKEIKRRAELYKTYVFKSDEQRKVITEFMDEIFYNWEE